MLDVKRLTSQRATSNAQRSNVQMPLTPALSPVYRGEGVGLPQFPPFSRATFQPARPSHFLTSACFPIACGLDGEGHICWPVGRKKESKMRSIRRVGCWLAALAAPAALLPLLGVVGGCQNRMHDDNIALHEQNRQLQQQLDRE